MLEKLSRPEVEIFGLVSFVLAQTELMESYAVFCAEAERRTEMMIEFLSEFPDRVNKVGFPEGSILQKEIYRLALELKKEQKRLA